MIFPKRSHATGSRWWSLFPAVVLALGLAVAVSRPASAASPLRLRGWGGILTPGNHLLRYRGQGEALNLRQRPLFVYGGAVIAGISRRFAVEGDLLFGQGKVNYEMAGAGDMHASARQASNVLLTGVSLSGRIYVHPPIALSLVAGPVLVHRGGAYFRTENGPEQATNAGAMFGTGLEYGFWRGALRLRADVRNYSTTYRASSRFDSRFQNDVAWTFGLDFAPPTTIPGR